MLFRSPLFLPILPPSPLLLPPLLLRLLPPSSPQFGNTCYCNSVLQALYFCRPFRENVLGYRAQQKRKETLLPCRADLFHSITTQKKKVGVIPPKKFISRLRKENGEGGWGEGKEGLQGTGVTGWRASWGRGGGGEEEEAG